MISKPIKVFLVDDEPPALRRLTRLLEANGNVEIVGQTNAPVEALRIIPNLKLDAIFLDIQMPEITGFELLNRLETYPPVIFTTAYDKFALRAFEVFSVDYLLKPIESERLEMALNKLSEFAAKNSIESITNIKALVENIALNNSPINEISITRIASRIGGKSQILDVSKITHFFAQDKLTIAKTAEGKEFPLDDSLNALEAKLDPRSFLRVHRSSIVNLNFIAEVHGWFSGKILVRLNSPGKSEIAVARDKVKSLKRALGM